MGQMIEQFYDPENGTHDAIACDIVTTMLEIPGVAEAVLIDAMRRSNLSMKHDGMECIEDIPFRHAWNVVFNPQEVANEQQGT